MKWELLKRRLPLQESLCGSILNFFIREISLVRLRPRRAAPCGPATSPFVDAKSDNLGVSPGELRLQLAMTPSSVVHTGVKSFGCENKTAQLSPIHS